jgi:hypothetical protein
MVVIQVSIEQQLGLELSIGTLEKLVKDMEASFFACLMCDSGLFEQVTFNVGTGNDSTGVEFNSNKLSLRSS